MHPASGWRRNSLGVTFSSVECFAKRVCERFRRVKAPAPSRRRIPGMGSPFSSLEEFYTRLDADFAMYVGRFCMGRDAVMLFPLFAPRAEWGCHKGGVRLSSVGVFCFRTRRNTPRSHLFLLWSVLQRGRMRISPGKDSGSLPEKDSGNGLHPSSLEEFYTRLVCGFCHVCRALLYGAGCRDAISALCVASGMGLS